MAGLLCSRVRMLSDFLFALLHFVASFAPLFRFLFSALFLSSRFLFRTIFLHIFLDLVLNFNFILSFFLLALSYPFEQLVSNSFPCCLSLHCIPSHDSAYPHMIRSGVGLVLSIISTDSDRVDRQPGHYQHRVT